MYLINMKRKTKLWSLNQFEITAKWLAGTRKNWPTSRANLSIPNRPIPVFDSGSKRCTQKKINSLCLNFSFSALPCFSFQLRHLFGQPPEIKTCWGPCWGPCAPAWRLLVHDKSLISRAPPFPDSGTRGLILFFCAIPACIITKWELECRQRGFDNLTHRAKSFLLGLFDSS